MAAGRASRWTAVITRATSPGDVTYQSVSRLPRFAQRKPQMDQRPVAAAVIDQGLQVGVAPMAAHLASASTPDVAGSERRPESAAIQLICDMKRLPCGQPSYSSCGKASAYRECHSYLVKEPSFRECHWFVHAQVWLQSRRLAATG
jgi:hypothetical protein